MTSGKEQTVKSIRHSIIWFLALTLLLGLMGCTPEKPEEELPPPPPVCAPETGLTAGERAAARLQQSESGLMADGLRIPLPPPPVE